MFNDRFARWMMVIVWVVGATACDEESTNAELVNDGTDVDDGTIADAGAGPTHRPPEGEDVEPTWDGGAGAVVDAGPAEEPPPLDGGDAGDEADAGGEGPIDVDAGATACFRAKRLWFEDFETGNYARWSGTTYGNTSVGCARSGFSTERRRSGNRSHRTSVGCTANQSHRVYSGVQFNGDTPLARYTNRGSGIDAPYGIVNTYWHWLDVPYSFGNGRWFSPFTVNNSCDWSDRVITLGLENSSNRLTPAHLTSTGGTMSFAPNAPSFPLRRWVRTTIYVNYYDGAIHVWQDGQKLAQGTFSRRSRQICQFHWGLYASASNSNIVLFEDDLSIWKLNQRWTNFNVEPYFGVTQPVCN